MNLAENPTVEQLRDLLRGVDDDVANHLLWVDLDGDVHLSALEPEEAPVDFMKTHGRVVKFRFEAWCQGNGYAGATAAADDAWVTKVMIDLADSWNRDRRGLIDY